MSKKKSLVNLALNPRTSTVKAVYYGLEEQVLLNVTAQIIQLCSNDAESKGVWVMPADDLVRARLFSDPIPYVAKKIYVRVDTLDGDGISEIVISSDYTCSFSYLNGIFSLSGFQRGIKIELIIATMHSEESFWSNAALGISLKRINFDASIVPRITFNNKKGLPAIYNDAIESANQDSYLVFMHDDVWIDDYFFAKRIIEGLNHYDIIGLAGNRRRVAKQPAWLYKSFDSGKLALDQEENLSGAVAHGKSSFGGVSYFGSSPAACELLDGVLLATKKSVLVNKNCKFDEAFDFHFYDMDFCRRARSVGLSLGTWPIAITHQSGGDFVSELWLKNHATYIDKWEE
jgi:glycosyltransferase involved in cell wall biosynthesis